MSDKPDVAALTEDQAMEIFRAENRRNPYGSIYRSIRTAYAAGRASLSANVSADVAALTDEQCREIRNEQASLFARMGRMDCGPHEWEDALIRAGRASLQAARAKVPPLQINEQSR